MAELRKITERPALSNFSRAQPQGGTAFLGLAGIMQEAYRALEPAAMQEAERRGMEQGVSEAQQNLGEPRPLYGLYNPTQAGGPGPRAPEEVGSVIAAAAERHGVDPGVLNTIASIESNFNPRAQNPNSSAGGLFQFIDGTAAQYGLADRFDPVQASDAAARLTRDNAAALRRALGREPNVGELYLAHQQGAGGAISLLTAGPRLASSVVGREAVRLNGGDPDTMSAQEFADIWIGKAIERSGAAPMEARVSSGGLAPVLGEPEVAAPPENNVIRNSDGRLEARRYSPLSGPILQAHNAAADLAYASEATNRFITDMVSVASQMVGNPEGIRNTGQAMIDRMVEDANENLRPALRMQLEQELGQVFRGAVDQQHREIRQRAANQNLALVNRYSDDYADALMSGDEAEINAARQRLEETLIARTSLPGLAYTPEQANNVLIAAEEQASQMIARQQQAQIETWEDELDEVIGLVERGLTAENEHLVMDPQVQAAHPDLARRAAAGIMVRENMPGFLTLPPAEQRALIEQRRAEPFEYEWEADLVDAMETAATASQRALEEDPIAWAAERQEQPPPPLPDIQGLIGGEVSEREFTRQFQRRLEYGNAMAAAGYVPQPNYFTNEERQALSNLVSPDTDASIRAASAIAMIQAAGPNAGRVMDELDASPGLVHAARLAAAGGSPDVTRDIALGMTRLSDNSVNIPSRSDFNAALQHKSDMEFADAVPNHPRLVDGVLDATMAIYANDARGMEQGASDREIAEVMDRAFQRAMGQHTDRFGVIRGGVQPVFDYPALLPPNVNASEVEAIFSRAQAIEAVNRPQGSGFQREAGASDWDVFGGPIPQWDNMLLSDSGVVDVDALRMVPLISNSGNLTGQYRIEYGRLDSSFDVVDQNGDVFIFRMNDLIGGS